MKKRLFWLGLSAGALFLGALLYSFFRQDTYIGKLVAKIFLLDVSVTNSMQGFFAWYFPDCLWAFSLTCTLFSITLPQGRQQVVWCVVSLAWGILWEVLQLVSVVSGTADLWDVIMYIIAVFSAAMINILKRGK